MKKWEIISSDYIHRRPWGTLRSDTVKLPSGFVKKEYYVLEYPSWVNMVAITEDRKILFVRQYRHGAQKIMLELPAGVVEANEPPELAAKRELLEETGYSFDSIEQICELYANPATSGNLTYTYLLRGGKKTHSQQLDDSEDIEIVPLSIEEAKSLLLNNQIGQSLHASALFYCLHKIGVFR